VAIRLKRVKLVLLFYEGYSNEALKVGGYVASAGLEELNVWEMYGQNRSSE